MSERPTGTVTFLFTDVEGSTRLWEDRPDAMRDALARHDYRKPVVILTSWRASAAEAHASASIAAYWGLSQCASRLRLTPRS